MSKMEFWRDLGALNSAIGALSDNSDAQLDSQGNQW